MMITDYTVVLKDHPIELQERVMELVSQGWELQGGVSVSVSESDEYRYVYYAQALIKVERRTSITKA